MDQATVLPTVVTFNTLIESCARNGKAQRAREVLELMKKRGLNPDERSFSAVVQVSDIYPHNSTPDFVSLLLIRCATCM
jgi:pentatricopeptide repeat protein